MLPSINIFQACHGKRRRTMVASEAVFQIRIQLNPDPAKNRNPDLDPEDLKSGSGSRSKLFLKTTGI